MLFKNIFFRKSRWWKLLVFTESFQCQAYVTGGCHHKNRFLKQQPSNWKRCMYLLYSAMNMVSCSLLIISYYLLCISSLSEYWCRQTTLNNQPALVRKLWTNLVSLEHLLCAIIHKRFSRQSLWSWEWNILKWWCQREPNFSIQWVKKREPSSHLYLQLFTSGEVNSTGLCFKFFNTACVKTT